MNGKPNRNPIPRPKSRHKGHLPRLQPHRYQAHAVVFWTLTLENRACGWLSTQFHSDFREWMLHAAAREGIFCPVYCLMPDHTHHVWMGLRPATNQLDAMRFLRGQFNLGLEETWCRTHRATDPSPNHNGESDPRRWSLQDQAHDHVLRPAERERDALQRTCDYVLNNPVRAALVERTADYPYCGAIVPGYPRLHPLEDRFWPLYWRLFAEAREDP